MLSLCLCGLLVAGLPLSNFAAVSANLSWVASSDPNVAGYTIYYGGTSQQYTNSVTVGNVTNAVITGLNENIPYYFAAKALDNSGNLSAFSNEAIFEGVHATPNGNWLIKLHPASTNSDPFVYSLGAGAPPGMTINPTNGVISWTPGLAYASTTNYISVIVTDTANSALNTAETLVMVVGDYLSCQVGATSVYAGQSTNLPLTVTSSSTVTNVQVTIAWPGNALLNPTLTFSPPVIAGSLQVGNNQLVVQLETAAGQPLSGTNQAAQINFDAAPGQPSAILSIPATAASGNTADGAAYANTLAQSGEVVVVGGQTIMRPQTSPAGGRVLSLYANPGNYVLLYTTSLVTPVNWQPVLTYQQTNAVQTVSLDSSNPIVFYTLQAM